MNRSSNMNRSHSEASYRVCVQVHISGDYSISVLSHPRLSTYITMVGVSSFETTVSIYASHADLAAHAKK